MFLVSLKRNLLQLCKLSTHLFKVLGGQSGCFKSLFRIVRHLFPSFLEFLEHSVPQLFKFSTFKMYLFSLIHTYIIKMTPQTPFASVIGQSRGLDHNHNPIASVKVYQIFEQYPCPDLSGLPRSMFLFI